MSGGPEAVPQRLLVQTRRLRLHQSLLQKVGVEHDKFGDSTGTIAGAPKMARPFDEDSE
jgi:hypothetical protein